MKNCPSERCFWHDCKGPEHCRWEDLGASDFVKDGKCEHERTLPQQEPELERPAFRVIDKVTGKDVTFDDGESIATNHDNEERHRWAQNLMYCDMNGWVVDISGGLYLTDECGRFEFAPEDQYEVRFEGDKK